MGVNELLKAIDDLSEADLEDLVDRALFVRAQRRVSNRSDRLSFRTQKLLNL
jgi:hypothetical protein